MSSENYSSKMVAEALGVHPTTVRQWVRRGKIEPLKNGRHLVFTPQMLEDMREMQREGKLGRPHSHTAVKLEALNTMPEVSDHLDKLPQ